ncbi:hypothetical protein B0H11DRAFT_2019797 [Mycena galericulata]|nr:hypothetical protein B0H11DRAFT_2019797 [Mycena galericulata]
MRFAITSACPDPHNKPTLTQHGRCPDSVPSSTVWSLTYAFPCRLTYALRPRPHDPYDFSLSFIITFLPFLANDIFQAEFISRVSSLAAGATASADSLPLHLRLRHFEDDYIRSKHARRTPSSAAILNLNVRPSVRNTTNHVRSSPSKLLQKRAGAPLFLLPLDL